MTRSGGVPRRTFSLSLQVSNFRHHPKTHVPTLSTNSGISIEKITFKIRPTRAMRGSGTRPLAKTIAFGGVPTGSMKAQLAAITAGKTSTIGA
jgi:hypothetical protein